MYELVGPVRVLDVDPWAPRVGFLAQSDGGAVRQNALVAGVAGSWPSPCAFGE
ncbi:Uncharacterised protein [Mycobacteroides abscessus]|nr:Uncharacterised protein [Mycobacteroides abscessus]